MLPSLSYITLQHLTPKPGFMCTTALRLDEDTKLCNEENLVHATRQLLHFTPFELVKTHNAQTVTASQKARSRGTGRSQMRR